jgi:hypothetical protein
MLRVRHLVLVAIAGCGGSMWNTRERVPVPRWSRPSYGLAAASLGDDAAVRGIGQRVRLARYGRGIDRVSVLADGSPSPVNGWHHHEVEDAAGVVVPVIGERRGQIRVVVESDHARFAMWIDRGDTAPTLVAPTALADREGFAPRDTGAWLEPGVTIDAGETADDLRAITVVDDALDLRGWVAASIVREVWTEPPAGTPIVATAKLSGGATVRSDPEADAPTIGRVRERGANAKVVGTRGAWTEVVVQRPRVRVHGWVTSAEVTVAWAGAPMPADRAPPSREYVDRSGSFTVPAGACLYDAPDGQVVGVQRDAVGKWGAWIRDGGWHTLYLESEWARFEFYVHDTSGDRKQPTWDRCP